MPLKGRTPTINEKKHMDRVVQLGCIVCRNLGYYGTPSEIHHINGKTKDECHFQVLPLCVHHHRGGKNIYPMISRHPYKKLFEQTFGKESELLEQVNKLLREYETSKWL